MIGAEDRVGGDARRIVVGEPGEYARADDRGERGETAACAQPPTRFVVPAGPASVQVPHHGIVWRPGGDEIRRPPQAPWADYG